MKNYPFIFLNHGSLDPECAGKNSECYIWFNRDVTAVERKRIVETCPPPLSRLFVWGDHYAYFGSGGDTYDIDIICCYAGKEAVKRLLKISRVDDNDETEANEFTSTIDDRSILFPDLKLKKTEFGDFDSAFGYLLDISVSRLSKDLENWAQQIHQMVPVTFLKAPHGADNSDNWNRWSYQRLENALQTLINYIDARPGVLSGEVPTFGGETTTDLNSHSFDMEVLPYSERIRYFHYIFHDVLLSLCYEDEGKKLTDDEREKRLALADLVYERDGITETFDRLSYKEHYIHVNDEIILSALNGLEASERQIYINKLKPYTRLAYFASYGALKAEDLLQYSDPAAYLHEIVDLVPDQRKQAITCVLSMIAHNLIHVTPAYSKHDVKHAKPASEIFEMVCMRQDAVVKDYISGTVCCEWAGQPAKGLEIAEAGLKKFPQNKNLIHNAISVCNLTGNHGRARELLNRYEALSDKPDENFVLNKSYTLLKSQQLGEAQNILAKYIEQGGKKSPSILVNLFYTWWFYKSPEKEILKQYMDEVSHQIKNDVAYQSNELLENFLGLISSREYYSETIAFFEDFQQRGITLSPSCWVNYTYAACFLNKAEKERISEKIDVMLPEIEVHFGSNPLTFGNVAAIYTSLDNTAKAIQYLKLAKKYNYPDYNSLRMHEDFNSIQNRKEFQELFD